MGRIKTLGPGLLVTAAFIGPGTVTTATTAGASFGFALLWAVAFSTVATIILQEMSARLGIVTRMGLGEALRDSFRGPARAIVLGLVSGAIVFGNSAFQAGNIVGASIGLEAATGISVRTWAILIAVTVTVLLVTGTYRRLEAILIATVVLMSVGFIATALGVKPDLPEAAKGMWPSMPRESGVIILALIGTTVVPYNLFLHASSVRQKWPASIPTPEALSAARFDAVVSISLGGLLTACILITAASFFKRGAVVDSAGEMAAQLKPLMGAAGEYLFLGGLVAAGLSSAITAPLAAAYAACGAFNWPQEPSSWRFRAAWLVVLGVGAAFAIWGHKPVQMIRLAQALNGVLLPVIAGFLLYVMNRRSLLGSFANRAAMNLAGGIAILVTAALGAFLIAKALRPVG
jgi:manganese transport protein